MNEVELGWPAMLLVAFGGILSGAMFWRVLLIFSNAAELRLIVNRIVAHLFEIRLFATEPRLILRAQRDLFIANGKFLVQMGKPSLVLLFPLMAFYLLGEGFLSHAPLAIGRPAIVTARFFQKSVMDSCAVRLFVPAGFVLETKPMSVPSSLEVLWRIRPKSKTVGLLRLSCGSHLVTEKISSAPGFEWLPETSGNQWTERVKNLLHPSDARLPQLFISYPHATIFGASWLVWFVVFSLVGSCQAALVRSVGGR